MSEDKFAKPYMQFNKLSMRCYLPRDIRKLSVVELNQTKTFDEAGFSIKGGLYDLALGPSMPQAICETCGLRGSYCPGHYGHIQLSVPVFNPLFFSFTFNLMKGSCIHCHRFTCKTDSGDVVAFLAEWSTLSKDLVKNNVAVKHAKLKEFLRENLFKRRIKCSHCKKSNGILRNDAGRAFILDFTTNLNSIRKSENTNPKKSTRRSIGTKRFTADDMLEAEENIDEKPDNKVLQNDVDFSAKEASSVLDPLSFSEKFLNQQLNMVINRNCDKLIWRAVEVREHFRLLWKREYAVMRHFFPIFEECNEDPNFYSTDVLFCQTILVQPSKFRPQRFLRGDTYEHPITANYRLVMEADQLLTVVKIVLSGKSTASEALNLIDNKVVGKSLNEKLHNAYLNLQLRVNCLYDQNADKISTTSHPGLKQIIEKKEGIFRMNMMGKRVDYACRSVITPDPYLDVDEIGIPELFARKLTFQESINFLNTTKLRESVRNGPSNYPGANFVQFQGGFKQVLPVKESERIAISRRLTGGATKNIHSMPSFVFRHLERGDHLLMNRQPSLHKPSIMGHKARILKGQKALRMNYAPCKAYNADFDGDEMNGHFLQNRVAQSEASELANVGSNYLVPKDGTPILGLIQDHVVSGVLLTLRDRFLTKSEFMQLVFSAFAESTKRINIPPPAMFKPELRWTGKQVITTLLLNLIPVNRPKINLFGKAKTALSNWRVPGVEANLNFDMSESQVIFREGELLCGVLDKEHYGATQYGLIHCCFELYGSKVSTSILSCFSRLFTTFLQRHGFTLGVADILVCQNADKIRRNTIRELRKVGPAVVQKTFNLPENATPAQIRQVLAVAYNNSRRDRSDVKQLDFTMKQVMAKLCEQINNACVPKGLIRCFPENALQLMIQSGAKGSMVNSIQISCALGQIELEGQRPPLSAVGRTLPSFQCFDPSPRAGGFVDQRFLTGLKPQELFFHTMAGREGLVDTAVKTSRSGYLQRCIIKHLEGISIRYDHTARDHDGSVIQFRYGEDGLDVGRAIFLNPRQFSFLEQNVEAVRQSIVPVTARYDASEWNVRRTEKYFKRITKWKKARRREMVNKSGEDNVMDNCKIFDSSFLKFCKTKIENTTKAELIKEWRKLSEPERESIIANSPAYMDSVDVKFNPITSLGALPEKILEEIASFSRQNDVSTEFRRVMFWKGLRAFADPGENVGLLAAQSIGEPSTQMTLNTFHFAGRGEMNVTLGIPRLREILMTSGKNISTPMTEVFIRHGVSDESVEKLKRDLNPVGLKQLIKRFIIDEEITVTEGRLWRGYTLTIELLRNKHREASARHVERSQIISEIERRLLKEIAQGVGKRFKEVLEHQQIQHKRLRSIAKMMKSEDGKIGGENDEGNIPNPTKKEDASSDEDDEGGDGAADEARLKRRHMDDAADYEGEEGEQGEVCDDDPAANLNGEAADDDLVGVKDAEGDEEPGKRVSKQKAVKQELLDVLEFLSEDDEQELIEEDDSEAEIRRQKLVQNGVNKTEPSTVMDKNRVAEVIQAHALIVNYSYDFKSDRWCTVKYQLPLKNKTKIDVMAIVEKAVSKFIVTQVSGIQKAIVREDTRNGKTTKILQVQGVNMEALLARSDILDVNTLYSNDINFMLNKYGIEACGRTIEKEMNNVFGVYGIEVNPRHLSLTADYMTFTGEVLPFSRGAMASNASTLQKMTFETTAVFLRDSIITGQSDNLCSPSARLVTGQLHRSGTGAFDLLEEPIYAIGTSKRKQKLK